MKFHPLQDRILVKRIEAVNTTPSGLIIPPTATEKPLEGEVVATGPGRFDDHGNFREVRVRVGERVLFAKFAGVEIKLDGVDHLVLREDELLGVVTDD